jgi:hypothetical protein
MVANRKLLKRIVGITLQGNYVEIKADSRVYVDKKRYYIVDQDENEQKYLKRLVSELHKINIYDNQIQVIPV